MRAAVVRRGIGAGARASLLLAIGAVAVAPAGAAAPGPDVSAAAASAPDPREILRRAEARYDSLRTLRARFRQTIEMRAFEPPRRREGRGIWYQRRPSHFRMDFEEPEGDVIVADGRHLWLHYPSTHPGQVVRSRLAGGSAGREMIDLQGRIFEQAVDRYEPEYVESDEIGGHPVHVIRLVPRDRGTDYRRVRIWIDRERLLVRRLRFEDRSETVRTITLSELETGVRLPDSLFRYRPPEGVEVFEG